MQYDFDTERDRRGSDSAKWKKYGPEVLPMWVADMDFISAEPVLRALHERVDHGFFGYVQPMEELCQALRLRLKSLYAWEIQKRTSSFSPAW